ncbi:MAG TPA: hypothetical protein DCY88_25725 [Cyanobacteria bacterium UBA11372]|nr:hypothetical protein [Cyanobacteria bacterium UBA11372]
MQRPKLYSKSWSDSDAIASWIFLSPAWLLLGIFVLWLIAYLFYLSFTYAAAAATVLLAVTLVLVYLLLRAWGEGNY